jgi:neopullulanase
MPIETPAWVRDAVFYQVFPDRLARSGRVPAPGPLEPWDVEPTVHGVKGGDLYGVAQHLDRLQALGITALYLNPVLTSASSHRYHTDDYTAVDPLLGGDAALRELLDAAHAREMRVVLDGVFNHCGRGWWPFVHLMENGAASPYRDWFHLGPGVREGDRGVSAYPSAEQQARMDEIRADGAESGVASREVLGYEAWWDLPALPKLNLEHPEARAHILDVSERWIRFGADGWRLDVAEEVSGEFWREFRSRVKAVDPEAYLVAEVWHHKPEWLQGDMFDAFMNYPQTLGILGFAGQDRLATDIDLPAEYHGRFGVLDGPALWDRLVELRDLNDPAVTAVQLNLLGSHDTPRLRTLLGGDLASVRLAMLLQLTLPGAPSIYYGDEIGIEGGMDPLCRAAFPEDPTAWEAEPYGWTADLLALRHASRALRDGSLELLRAEGPAIALLRRHGSDAFVVLANAGASELTWELELPTGSSKAALVRLRGGRVGARAVTVEATSMRLTVPPREGLVARLS